MRVNSKNSDKLGIFLSVVCAVHCLTLPILTVTFPVVKTFHLFDDHMFHLVMFFLILIPAMLSFIPHALKTKDFQVLIIPGIAIGILILSNFIFHLHGQFSELAVNVLSSALLIYAHYRHYKTKTCCH